MTGLYFEEFEEGKVYKSQGRTITETDVVNFAGLSGDFNPLHMDEEFAKEGTFGKRIAHGMLGAAIMTGLSNQMGLFEGTTIAFLDLSIVYKSPLLIGDTVHLELTLIKKKYTSEPKKGVMTFQTNLVNQQGKLITSSNWNLLMRTKGE